MDADQGGSTLNVMSTTTERPIGNCPSCHRADVTRRVVIGQFERDLCRMCADSYKRSPGIVVEILVLGD
ncbi:MAG TPA: hypothetical protein VGN51_11805 [Acidimicrobiia bacterium]|jgi:hypothetical protein